MLIVIADQAIEQHDQGVHRLAVVDQIGGPQTLLPQVCQFQPADTPERFEKFIARLESYRGYMAANTDILREGLETGLTAPRIVAERTIAQLDRLMAIPLVGGDRPGPRPGRVRCRSRARPAGRRGRDVPGRPGLPRRPQGRLLPGNPRGARPVVGPDGESLYRTPDPRVDDARPRPARGPRDRDGGAPRRRRRPAQDRDRGGCGEPEGVSPAARRRPGQHARDRRRSCSPAPERTSSGRWPSAPRFFGTLPKAGCEVKAVEEFKEKDAPFAYYFPPATDGSRRRHLLRQRLRPAEPEIHEARDDDLPRGGPRSPLPDRARAGEREPLDVPPARRPDRRRRVRRGLGPVQREAGRRDGPLPRRWRALRDARRGRLAGRPAGRRYGAACAALDPPAIDRLPARDRAVRDGRDDRDGPLHRLAGPGADVHDRLPRDREAPRAS